MKLKNIVICGKKLENMQKKNIDFKIMITWIIYIIVGLILFFVLYLAILGINRGVEAKNKINQIIQKNNKILKKYFW